MYIQTIHSNRHPQFEGCAHASHHYERRKTFHGGIFSLILYIYKIYLSLSLFILSLSFYISFLTKCLQTNFSLLILKIKHSQIDEEWCQISQTNMPE